MGEGNKIGEELKKKIKQAERQIMHCHKERDYEMEAYWCGVADAYARVLRRFGKGEDV